jgi:catechol 2,3-dioxygenase-like lactoylglutathione lyase family enzyme
MIDHLSTAVTDITKARAFYDAVLSTLGAGRLISFEREGIRISGYGREGKPSFWIVERAGEKAAPRQGHLAFGASNRPAVDAFYETALAAGATDNGAPGLRPHYHADYYASFVIDPDGHRLEAVCHHRPE